LRRNLNEQIEGGAEGQRRVQQENGEFPPFALDFPCLKGNWVEKVLLWTPPIAKQLPRLFSVSI
jgi:hypothetical protein